MKPICGWQERDYDESIDPSIEHELDEAHLRVRMGWQERDYDESIDPSIDHELDEAHLRVTGRRGMAAGHGEGHSLGQSLFRSRWRPCHIRMLTGDSVEEGLRADETTGKSGYKGVADNASEGGRR